MSYVIDWMLYWKGQQHGRTGPDALVCCPPSRLCSWLGAAALCHCPALQSIAMRISRLRDQNSNFKEQFILNVYHFTITVKLQNSNSGTVHFWLRSAYYRKDAGFWGEVGSKWKLPLSVEMSTKLPRMETEERNPSKTLWSNSIKKWVNCRKDKVYNAPSESGAQKPSLPALGLWMAEKEKAAGL